MNTNRPVTGRPPFGEVRFFRGEAVRLVSYINDHAWYWIPATHHNVPPKRESFVSWHSLIKVFI